MKSTTSRPLLAALFILPAIATLQAGDPSPATTPKKAPAPRPPAEAAPALEVRRDPIRANFQPVAYINVRVASQRSRAPWAPGAPGD